MATFLYDKARESFLSQNPALDWDTDTIKVLLVTSGYTPNSASDQYLSTIVSGNRVAISDAALGTKTVAAGVAGAAACKFTSVAAGSTVAAIVIYKDTGNEATSPLIAYIDGYTGLPLATNGGDITINWPTDANKIFKL